MEDMAYGLRFLYSGGLTPHAVKITGGVTTRLQPMEAKNMVCLLSTKE